MNILIFDQNGGMRREAVKRVSSGVYYVSDTEGYMVEKGREAIEIRPPLMGFNPLGLFPPKKGLLLVAAANDPQPLVLQAGRKNHYRPVMENNAEAMATRMKDVEMHAVLIAGQRSERKVVETKKERLVGHVIYVLLVLFVVLLIVMIGPNIAKLGESMPW